MILHQVTPLAFFVLSVHSASSGSAVLFLPNNGARPSVSHVLRVFPQQALRSQLVAITE